MNTFLHASPLTLVALFHPGDLATSDWLLILTVVLAPLVTIYAVARAVTRRTEVSKLFDDQDTGRK